MNKLIEPQDTWNRLKNIELALGVSGGEVARLLDISEKLYDQMKQEGTELPLDSVLALTERLSITLEAFQNGRIDYATLARQYFGDVQLLPKRYTVGGLSKKWSLLNMLNYAQFLRGNAFRAYLLRHFQLNESIFIEPDGAVNIVLMTEVLEYLRSSGFTDHEFFDLGVYTYFTNRKSPIAAALMQYRNSKDVFEKTVSDLFIHFDRNTLYGLLRLRDDSCVLEAIPNEEVCDLLNLRSPGNTDGCIQKSGVIAMLPCFAGLGPAEVTEISCIHHGHQSCRFEVHFDRTSPDRMPSLRIPRYQRHSA